MSRASKKTAKGTIFDQDLRLVLENEVPTIDERVRTAMRTLVLVSATLDNGDNVEPADVRQLEHLELQAMVEMLREAHTGLFIVREALDREKVSERMAPSPEQAEGLGLGGAS